MQLQTIRSNRQASMNQAFIINLKDSFLKKPGINFYIEVLSGI